MGRSPICQFAVDFIGEHQQVAAFDHLGHRFQIGASHDGARRIVRERKHQQLGAGRQLFLDLLRRQTEAVLRLRLNDHGNAARHAGQRSIADKAGLRDENLVARSQQRAEAQIDGFAAADRDKKFLVRIVFHLIMTVEPAGDLLPQLGKAAVRAVPRFAVLQRPDSLLPDMPGSHEIRLADGEGDHILHLVCNIKKLADPRGRDLEDRRVHFLLIINHRARSSSRRAHPPDRAPPRHPYNGSE